MVEIGKKSYRAWLGLEFESERREALARWLRESWHGEPILPAGAPELVVRLAGLAGRRPGARADLARTLEDLEAPVITVEFGRAPRALPSRHYPAVYVLPVRCTGWTEPFDRLLAGAAPACGAVRAGRREPYLLLGTAKARPAVLRQPLPELPEELREPVDAVRLGLYCSQTTPERRLDPLAQVKLPTMQR